MASARIPTSRIRMPDGIEHFMKIEAALLNVVRRPLRFVAISTAVAGQIHRVKASMSIYGISMET